jgi:hypothetical protein
MSDRSISRGTVISLIAGIPLAVTSAANAASSPVPATPAPALLTVAQLRANYKYVDQAPNPAQATCATCYAFRPVYASVSTASKATPGPIVSATCLLVPGPIQPGGWCSVWGLNPSLKAK